MPAMLGTISHAAGSANDLQEQIRRRAYELYEQRGQNHGHETDDWLQAESEVNQSTTNRIAA